MQFLKILKKDELLFLDMITNGGGSMYEKLRE